MAEPALNIMHQQVGFQPGFLSEHFFDKGEITRDPSTITLIQDAENDDHFDNVTFLHNEKAYEEILNRMEMSLAHTHLNKFQLYDALVGKTNHEERVVDHKVIDYSMMEALDPKKADENVSNCFYYTKRMICDVDAAAEKKRQSFQKLAMMTNLIEAQRREMERINREIAELDEEIKEIHFEISTIDEKISGHNENIQALQDMQDILDNGGDFDSMPPHLRSKFDALAKKYGYSSFKDMQKDPDGKRKLHEAIQQMKIDEQSGLDGLERRRQELEERLRQKQEQIDALNREKQKLAQAVSADYKDAAARGDHKRTEELLNDPRNNLLRAEVATENPQVLAATQIINAGTNEIDTENDDWGLDDFFSSDNAKPKEPLLAQGQTIQADRSNGSYANDQSNVISSMFTKKAHGITEPEPIKIAANTNYENEFLSKHTSGTNVMKGLS